MDSKCVFSIQEFCIAHGISRGTFYNELKAGRGPRLMRVGSRVMVSAEAAQEWRRAMEENAEKEAAAA